MNLTEAKVICDSVSLAGKRITTLQLKYPRMYHSELMTHRVFSRNASSSRAIPVEKMIADVRKNMFIPEYWGKNQSGMQAKEELKGFKRILAESIWRAAGKSACRAASFLNKVGVHKQLVNRLLEPFAYISVVVTSTEWDNFFELRDHEDAQPEFQHLAKLMREAMDESDPVEREWHLPYLTDKEENAINELFVHPDKPARMIEHFVRQEAFKVSTARCCRVSYLKHDGAKPNVDDDLKLFDRLVGSKPLHASPLEHQAIALTHPESKSRNFVGWQQYREIYEKSLK